MSNYSLAWDSCHDVLAQRARTWGWAVAIGAGTSLKAFPDWGRLVRELITADSRVSKPDELLETLSQDFSYDALIQAAKDILGENDPFFVRRLAELLYQNIKKKAGSDWANIAKALTAASPGQMKRDKWARFLDFIRMNYKSVSALQIAEAIIKARKANLAPTAVLSFNGEQLLYSLVHAIAATSASPTADLKEQRVFDRVTRGISHREEPRIPYIFCHGLIPMDEGFSLFPKMAAPEKLVFSEGEYLQLANSAFAWQSALFLGTAVLRSIVFIGLSFTDPNLRRWLAWVHANRAAELEIRGKDPECYEHYWLREDLDDEDEKRWIESCVRHLGVRLVWIKSWSKVGAYLERMLSL
jgi:SIR2-like domain